jgi:hypothetical protein
MPSLVVYLLTVSPKQLRQNCFLKLPVYKTAVKLDRIGEAQTLSQLKLMVKSLCAVYRLNLVRDSANNRPLINQVHIT